MTRPGFEDSVAGGDDDAEDVTSSNTGYVKHSRDDDETTVNFGKVIESQRREKRESQS
ncbi:hypothetical protein [Microcella humidisoli]|uniref:Uncharacterized protein n=1 Tax=Microcella humidisoli TaxID=2963406 RepID=A0ABY5FWB9_9MICO|nr:hypothetical protein [Microcella humidisoli]UTT62592.1 hypothetical protein NNL39_00265 [Microcella humidisoli]